MELASQILSDVVIFTKYARYIPELKRRETWKEIVDRNKFMHLKKFPKLAKEIEEAYKLVYDKKVLPSMRALQFSGKAIEVNPTRLFNCSFLPVDNSVAFSEIMFLLLSGTGVGYSVQTHHIDKLPDITKPKKSRRYLIGDSIEGWADSIKVLMEAYFSGAYFPVFDFSSIRAKGELLKTSGGKAPGPEPLRECLNSIKSILERKDTGDRITPIEAHDIVCFIADAVLAGGIRRCIKEGSRVIVSGKGFVPIEEVMKGDMVSTPDGWKEVTNTFNQGTQDTISINFQGGTLVCTPNHRVAVLSNYDSYEWKCAKDLHENDRLLFVYNEDKNGNNALPEFNYYKSDKVTRITDINIPELTEEIAWLIGAIQGDGYVYLRNDRGRVFVASTTDEPAYTDKIINALNQFGVIARPYKIPNEKTVRVEVFSKQLAKYLYDNVKQPNTPLKVPEFIKCSTPNIRAAFIQGLMDADGSIKTRPQQIVSTIYPEYAKDVKSLLASIGVVSRFKQLSKSKNIIWKQQYAVSLINNKDKKQFISYTENIHPIKLPFLQKQTQFGDGYPSNFIPNKPSGMTATTASQVTIDRIIEYGYDTKFHPLKIMSIEPHSSVSTYDIEVEDSHCFMCEGILVHNSATISLFDMDDDEMVNCKGYYTLPPVSDVEYHDQTDTYHFYVEYRNQRVAITMTKIGYEQYLKDNKLAWYMIAPQRGRANNTAVILRHKIKKNEFINLWKRVEISNAGEPGIFFTNDKDWGLNPCAEISLRPNQFCNLCTINVSDVYTQEELNTRSKSASFVATLQASYTDFHYLREEWKNTTDKEALIGVSMTGLASKNVLALDFDEASEVVNKENERVAKLIGINKAARTTCIKPEGTVSLVVGSSSGIHAWHDEYYIRRMRIGKGEPIYKYLADNHPELVEDDTFKPNIQSILSVPQKAPDNAILRSESAIDLLTRVSYIWKNWISPGHRKGANTNNVSTTVSIKDNEWEEVGEWMWKHREEFTALSVLPFDGGSYVQAPFETITKKKYEQMMKHITDIDLTKVNEDVDSTNLAGEVACGGGNCEVV